MKITFTILSMCICVSALASHAPPPWDSPAVPQDIQKNTLMIAIASPEIKHIAIRESNEPLVDLKELNHPRIQPMVNFDKMYQNSYHGYAKVRHGVYIRLLEMLKHLPQEVGIAYFEGYRPLAIQKRYFDKKYQEILQTTKNSEQAYQLTATLVSPYVDNIPVHCTGAAIDMTLFRAAKPVAKLLDMGQFDVIFGENLQQETFSPNTTGEQRANRLLLLSAAIKAGLVNYGYEWWHYSYGDKAWAYVTKEKAAIYGLID